MKNETKVILRKATIKDIPAFIEIEKSAPPKIYSAMTTEKEWQDELSRRNAVIYAIIKDDKIVGNVSYETKNEETAYISGLCIDSKFRGQGIGKKAIKLISEELKDFKRIELATHPNNENAVKLYKSFGFEIKSQIENYFGDGEPRIIMVLER